MNKYTAGPPVKYILGMANKSERQSTILDIIGSRRVSSQEELRRLLRSRGWDVTQATLSRDLRDLRVARVPSPDGPRYSAP
jgi:transcriptional regulator of arginine metabolism